jgi:hypothetical protein
MKEISSKLHVAIPQEKNFRYLLKIALMRLLNFTYKKNILISTKKKI